MMKTVLQNNIHFVSNPGSKKLFNTGKLIGNTPMHAFHSLAPKSGVKIYGKLEWHQLGGSVKARAAFRIIEQAIASGLLSDRTRLLDASSGNTAIAYGAIGASLGIPVTICLPANASSERKSLLRLLGVEVILTDQFSGTDGAQQEARELQLAFPDRYYYADQYSNDNNWKAHFYGTAREIYRQTAGSISHFVCGLGTTGSFTGIGRSLLEMNPAMSLTSLQPEGPMHGLEGWKDLETADVPRIYDPEVAHSIQTVETEEAYEMIKFIARHEGLLLSPSSAANLVGAVRLASELNAGTIVTLLPDNADKYSEVLKTLNL